MIENIEEWKIYVNIVKSFILYVKGIFRRGGKKE